LSAACFDTSARAAPVTPFLRTPLPALAKISTIPTPRNVQTCLADHSPGDFGLTGVGGVSCRSIGGKGSAFGGTGIWIGGNIGGAPFIPSPRGEAGMVTCG
jgi:hypothetical protein